MTEGRGHQPVMLREALDALAPTADDIVVDGTFGGGGYARALLAETECTVWAIDRDPAAVARGRDIEADFPGRLTVIHGDFGDMEALLARYGVDVVDGITFDLGVSSWQLDDGHRGFAFQVDGPLDMRMAREGRMAADIVNGSSESDLADLIYRYGEDPLARRIARAIVRRRQAAPIERTGELADLIQSAAGGRHHRHPATRTFQALRIAVNNEIGPGGQLEKGLGAAERLLRPGGRLVVVSFHSLEDREVKRFMASRAGAEGSGSRHRPPGQRRLPSMRLPHKRARRPSDEEIAANPRARSARLRTAVRTEAPPWPAREAA